MQNLGRRLYVVCGVNILLLLLNLAIFHTFLAGFLIFGIMTVVYLVPSYIAALRLHRNFNAIFALNVLIGWSFLGWVGAFVWALTSNVVSKQTDQPENDERI